MRVIVVVEANILRIRAKFCCHYTGIFILDSSFLTKRIVHQSLLKRPLCSGRNYEKLLDNLKGKSDTFFAVSRADTEFSLSLYVLTQQSKTK